MTTSNTVSISSVKESPTNPRKKFGDLEELATSIRTYGVLQPILVRPVNGHYECVFGHRRLRAAKKAGLDAIPAQVRELTDGEVLEAQLVENIQREDMHELEEADAYKHVIDAEVMGIEDLAAKVGKSKSYVYARLRLAELGKEARKEFLADKLSLAVALLLTRIIDPERQTKAVKQLLSRDAGRELREATFQLREHTHDLRQAPFDAKDAHLVAGAGPCGTCPKRSGNQSDLFGHLDEEGEEPETCTDIGCYDRKVDAHVAKTLAAAEAKGLKVINNAFDKYGQLQRSYVRADQTNPDTYRLPQSKTWKQLVGKELKPALSIDKETGAVVEIYDAQDARKAVPADVKAKLGRQTSSTRSASDAKAAAEARRRKQVRTAGLVALLDRISGDSLNDKLWQAIAASAARFAWSNVKSDVAARRGLDAKGHGAQAQLVQLAHGLKAGEAIGFVVEVLLGHGTYGGDGGDQSFRECCKAVGIDMGKVAAAVRAEEKEKLAAKTTKTKKGNAKRAAKAKALKTPPVRKTTTSGTCRVCGCTNEEACEDGCTWVDAEHTLCSNCEGA